MALETKAIVARNVKHSKEYKEKIIKTPNSIPKSKVPSVIVIISKTKAT